MYINFKMSITILSTLSLLACAEKSKISILDKPVIKYKVNKVELSFCLHIIYSSLS